MKRAIPILVILAVALSGAALAEEAEKAPDYSKYKAKELYKSLCKVCHEENSDAGEYTPMSLIMEQWDEFYDGVFAESHAEVAWPDDETKKVTDIFTEDMLKKLRKFCVDHAADSEQPMTCG